MHVVRVELGTYLEALYAARRAAAAEASEDIALAPTAEPDSVFPIVVPDDAAVAFDGGASDDERDESAGETCGSCKTPASSSPARAPKRKRPRLSLRADRAQPVRQRALTLRTPVEPDAVPPWKDSVSSPASDSAPDADTTAGVAGNATT